MKERRAKERKSEFPALHFSLLFLVLASCQFFSDYHLIFFIHNSVPFCPSEMVQSMKTAKAIFLVLPAEYSVCHQSLNRIISLYIRVCSYSIRDNTYFLYVQLSLYSYLLLIKFIQSVSLLQFNFNSSTAADIGLAIFKTGPALYGLINCKAAV